MADSNPIEVLRDFFDLNKMVRGSSEREDKCVAALDELATALEAAREDAARYRWLRDASSAAAPSFVANLCGADLDAAIDAAIDQARGKGVE